MRKFFLFAATATTALAQTLTLSGPPRVRVGETVTLRITYTPGVNPVSAFQFETPVQPWTTTLAIKTIKCNAANDRCILYAADNATPLAAGEVATVQWKVPANVPATVVLTNIVASSPDGIAVAVTAPPFNVVLYGDINGDRQLTTADTHIATDQALGLAACTSDLNNDGKCDALDVQLVANAVVEAQVRP